MLRKYFNSVNERTAGECILVAKAVASSIETLLGNGKSLKCCQSSGSSILTSSTSKILETIEIEHPAGFIINSACQSFQKEFGCGCTTLVCLVGYWTGALQNIADMGVPATVIVALLNEIAEELETVSKRSCISLTTVQEMDLNCSRFHHAENVFAQDLVRPTCNVSDKYSEQIDDKNTGHIVEDPVSNADLLAAIVIENHPTFTKNKTDCLPDVVSNFQNLRFENTTKSELHPALPNFELKSSSAECNYSKREEGENILMQDEFDACFDGLNLNEASSGKYEKPLSRSSISFPTVKLDSALSNENITKKIIGKASSDLFGERELGNSYSKSKRGFLNCGKTAANHSSKPGTVGPTSNEPNTRHANSNIKVSGNSISKSSKNITELLGISGKLSIQRETGNEMLANKNIFKKTNFKNVLLRSRHLADVSSFESSSHLQAQNNDAKFSHVNCGNEDGVHGNSAITRHNEQKDKHSFFYLQGETPKIEKPDRYSRQRDECWLDFLGRCLSHGKEHEMSLALDILQKQVVSSKNTVNEFSFLVDLITVQTVLGPPACNSCVLEGAVLDFSKENQSTIARDCNSPRRIALVNGDITYNYRHPGFKDPVQVTRTLNKDDFCNSSSNAQSKWMKQVMLVIKSFNLGVVAVHGHVANELRDNLQGMGVAVLENVSIRQLNTLSKMTATSIVSYLLNFTAHGIGKPVVIKIWNSGWSTGRHSAKSRAIRKSVFGQVGLWPGEEVSKPKSVVYSVVLCGPVQDLVDDSELKFWNCVHRLRNAFEDQSVLPGGGDIERLCIKHLEDIKDSKPPEKTSFTRWIQEDYLEFRPLIIDAICSGLKQFIARTNFNIDDEPTNQPCTNSDCITTDNSKTVFDNFSCKIEGWKRAIRIVKLFLNSEYHIITGF